MKKPISRVIRLPIKNWVLFSLHFVFFAVCCKSQKLDETEKTNEKGIVLAPLVEDSYYTPDSLQTLVITDFKSLNDFFRKVNQTRKPGIPVPNIDFSKEVVVLAYGGAHQNVKRLFLTKEGETEDTITIVVRAEPNEPSNTAISHPFCLYKMVKNRKSISFIKR